MERTYRGTFDIPRLRESLVTLFPNMWLHMELGKGGMLMIDFPDGYDPAPLEQAIYENDPKAVLIDIQAYRSRIVQMAQTAVGVRLQDLTAAQIKALMAILLSKAGGVDPQTLMVRPLDEWV